MAVLLAGAIALTLSPFGLGSASADGADVPFVTAPVPIIEGSPFAGDSEDVWIGSWAPTPDSIQVQWFLDGVAIAGDQQSSVLVPDAPGSVLTVQVTAIKAGYATTALTSLPSGPIVRRIIAGRPSISGTLKVGQTLTVDPGTWSPSDVTLAYQWSDRNGTIAGATTASYTLSEPDAGGYVWVSVTGTKVGYATRMVRVLSDPIPLDRFYGWLNPISGGTTVGSTLSVAPTPFWQPTPDLIANQWQRDGVDIEGATGATYVLQPADAGHTIDFTSTASGAGLPTATVTTAPTVPILPTFSATPTPSITGTTVIGGRLVASIPAWTPAAAYYTYSWVMNGVVVGTASTYTPEGESSVGQTVTVQVVGYSPVAGPGLSAVSAPTTPIARASVNVSHLSIAAAHLNAVLAPRHLPNAPDIPYSYQWTANGIPIPGATDRTYRPMPADYGKYMRVSVSVKGAGFRTTGATSNRKKVGMGYLTQGCPLITSATARVGSKLSATPGHWSPGPIHVTYEWVSTRGVWTVVGHSSTYTPTAADVGKRIYVFTDGTEKHFYPDPGQCGDDRDPVGRGIFSIVPAVSISGSAVVGHTLTAHHSAASPAAGAMYHYQWYSQTAPGAASIAMSHSTSSRFVIGKAQRGLILTVRVTVTKHAYHPASATSGATSTVA